ncbi:recombinase family protein [Aeromonas veronii]|uniref:recombinase family protein n=1 Tax=Aeromonas veronii TaxID=654 RepID=UPI000B59F340|nr:recombinase family protein [Aeromonas veronii]
MIVGYARVSSVGQSLDVQLEKLHEAGAEKVYQEKVSGKSTTNRAQLQAMLEFVREGDTVMITKLDRMGRSLADLLDIVNGLEEKGVSLRVLDQSIDTGSAQGRLMLSMLGAFAEFELELRKERQMDGIAKAKTDGKYMGRPRTLDDAPIREALLKGDKSPSQIAKDLGLGRSTVYKVAKAMREAGQLEQ